MKRTAIDSGLMSKIGYDSTARVLEIVFKNGQTFCYEEVPLSVYETMMATESIDQFTRDKVLNVYPYSEVVSPEWVCHLENMASTKDAAFLEEVSRILEKQGEVLVTFDYAIGYDARDFVIYQDIGSFKAKLETLETGSYVTVYRDSYLSLRGVVDDEFLGRAGELMAEAGEYMMLGLDTTLDHVREQVFWEYQNYYCVESYEELVEEADEFRGKNFAFGKMPPWPNERDEAVLFEARVIREESAHGN